MILFGGVPQGLALGHTPFKCRKFLWRDHAEGVFNECVRDHIVVRIHPSLLPWLRQCSVTADKAGV